MLMTSCTRQGVRRRQSIVHFHKNARHSLRVKDIEMGSPYFHLKGKVYKEKKVYQPGAHSLRVTHLELSASFSLGLSARFPNDM